MWPLSELLERRLQVLVFRQMWVGIETLAGYLSIGFEIQAMLRVYEGVTNYLT